MEPDSFFSNRMYVQQIDSLLKNLPPPDIDPVTHKAVETGFFQNLFQWNKNTDEPEKARNFLLQIIDDPQLKESLKDYSKKIIQIYERLHCLSLGDGTWADGIAKEWLVPDAELVEEDDEPLIRDLKTKILSNVLESPKKTYVETDIENDWVVIGEKPEAMSHQKKGHVFKHVPLDSVDTKFLFMLCADEFGAGSELEGGISAEMVQFLLNYLQKADVYPRKINIELASAINPVTPVVSRGFRLLDEDAKIQAGSDFIDLSKKQIRDKCEGGESLLIMGGWIGSPGHAIYYEIIPRDDGKVNFRLYNTGDGINHHIFISEGHKKKYLPYCEWKGIDIQNVTSDTFLRAIHELKNFDIINSKKTEYNADDVYIGLKHILKPEFSDDAVDEGLMMSPQRAGVCPLRSLMAFMRTKIPEEYKAFKCDFALNVLDAFVKAHENDKDVKVEEWRLVRKTHQSVARKVIKLYEAGIVGDDYRKEAQKILDASAKWVDKFEGCRSKRAVYPYSSFENCSLSRIDNKHKASRPLKTLTSGNKRVHAPQICTFCQEAFKEIPVSDAAKTLSNLERAKTIAMITWSNQEGPALHAGLIDFTKSLSLDSKFWERAIAKNPEFGDALIKNLSDLSNYFLKSCFTVEKPHVIDPEKIYVLGKLSYLQHVICRLNRPNFKNLVNPDCNIYFFTNFDDAKMHREMNIIRQNVVHTDNEAELLGDFKKKTGEPKLEYSYHKSHGWKPSFEDFIRQEYPEIIQKMTKEDPGFMGLSKVCQDARILISEHLPPWIKAMRDSAVSYDYLIHSEVGRLTKPYTDITPVYEVKDEKMGYDTGSVVTASLQGVSASDVYKNRDVKKDDKLRIKFSRNYTEERSDLLKTLSKFGYNRWEKEEFEKIKSKFQSDPDILELIHVFIKNELRHVELLEYFTKHPEKLKEKDHQIIFHYVLFSSYLTHNLDLKGFDVKLSSFIEKNYRFFLDENEIQTAIFLLKVSSKLKGFCPHIPLYQQTLQELKRLYNRQSDPEIKSAIASEWVAELSDKDSLTADDVKSLVALSIFIKEHKVETKNLVDPDTTRKVNLALIKHAHEIRETLQKDDNSLLNDILKSLRATGDKEWVMKSPDREFPYFVTKDGEYTLYPLNAELLSPNQECLLPLTIRENPLFKEHFPNISKATPLANGIFSFDDVLVTMAGEHIVIEKGNFRLVPSSIFITESKDIANSLISSRSIVQDYTIWQPLDSKELIAFNPKTKKPAYTLKSEGPQITEVRDVHTNLKLGKTSKRLTHFEDPGYIHEWYNDDNELVTTELPRYHLTFDKDFQCKEFKGYRLNLKKEIEALGVHHNYLVLENAKGEIKVILPVQELKKPEDGKLEVLLPRYEVNRSLKSGDLGKEKYFAYELDKAGMLTHKSREATLYLAKVLATAGQHKKAIRCLKKMGYKLPAFTEKEREILEGITNNVTGDQSGNAIAVRNLANYLLVHNAFVNHKPVSSERMSSLRKEYNLYLDHYNNITVFKLPKDAEIFILKALLRENFDPSHYLRLGELDPLSARKTVRIHKEIKSLKTHGDIDQYNTFEATPGRPLTTKPALTRAHDHIAKYFYHYYEIARTGSEADREWLKNALMFSGKETGMAKILKAVLEHPKEFPELLPNDSNPREAERKIKELAKKYAALSEEPPSLFKGDRTKKGFRLDKPEASFPISKNISLKEESWTAPTIASMLEKAPPFKKVDKNADEKLVKELQDTIRKIEFKDPVAAKEKKRLQDDLAVPSKTTEYILINEKSLQSVLELVENQSSILEHMKTALLQEANKANKDQTLEKIAGFHKAITLDELIIYFGRNNVQALRRRNPALSEYEALKLFKSVELYLLHATRDQHAARIRDKWNNKNELAEQATSSRCYDPSKHPSYLAFEYFSNKLMRPDQVKNFEEFLKNGNLNPIKEMIMGSGKSSVILILLSLLHPSFIIVPDSLLESVSSYTQETLQPLGQALNTLHFDRGTKFTKESLEDILDLINKAQSKNESIIMASKSVQCLLLRYIEKCTEHFTSLDKDKDFPEELHIMRKILGHLSESGNAVIDEADLILNVLHEVSFSFGKSSPPNPSECHVIKELYSIIYEDPEIRALARVESSSIPNNAPPLTQEDYEAKIKRRIAEKFVYSLPGLVFDSPELTQKVQDFGKNEIMIESHRQLDLIDYLCREEFKKGRGNEYFESLKKQPEIQNIIALAAEEISHLLPFTLAKVCDVKYGLDFDPDTLKIKGPLAIPYSAAKVPKSGSQFANPHITMNYTFQTYVKNGVNYDQIEDLVKMLLEKARLEMSLDKDLMLIDTPSWAALQAMSDGTIEVPYKYKPEHIQKLVAHINRNTASKLQFVERMILPQMAIYESKLSANPQNLVAMFLHVCGFTGTLWNALSMHHSLKPDPAEGTDARTLLALFKNSRDTAIEITEGGSLAMLKQLTIDYDMIIDAGGYFKDGSNSQIAHLVSGLRGKEVVFYDGEQMISQKEGSMPLAESDVLMKDRLTFLDQSHTTGADVTQKEDAIGLVTIGSNMLLRDLLQSVWRLRGLEKGQKARFLLTNEVADIIRKTLAMKDKEPIQFDHILRFVIKNQAKQQGLDNYKALRQELELIPQMLLLKVLMNENVKPEARLQAYIKLKSDWIKQANLAPKDRYGIMPTLIDSPDVLAIDKKNIKERIATLFKEMPWLQNELGITKQSQLELVNSLVLRLQKDVPAQLPSPSRDIEGDQTVEMDTKTDTNTQTDTQTDLEAQEAMAHEKINQGRVKGSSLKSYVTFQNFIKTWQEDGRTVPTFSLRSAFENESQLKPYAEAFDGIEITANVLEWNFRTHKDGRPHPSDFKFFGTKRVPFHHIQVSQGNVTLMSQEEAPEQRYKIGYYNLTLGFDDSTRKLPLTDQIKIVKLKFLNGESQFDKEELAILKKWLGAQGSERMREFYEKFVIAGHMQRKKAARYNSGSPLRQLLNELSKT